MWNFSQHQQLSHLHWLRPCCWTAPRLQQSNFPSPPVILSWSLETSQSNRNQSGNRHHGGAREPNREGELPSNTSQMAVGDIHPAEERDEEENTNGLRGRPQIRESEMRVTGNMLEWKIKSKIRFLFVLAPKPILFPRWLLTKKHVTLLINTDTHTLMVLSFSSRSRNRVRLFILHHLWQEAAARALMLLSMWQTSYEAVLIGGVCAHACVCFHPLDRNDVSYFSSPWLQNYSGSARKK